MEGRTVHISFGDSKRSSTTEKGVSERNGVPEKGTLLFKSGYLMCVSSHVLSEIGNGSIIDGKMRAAAIQEFK
jgi:hypothetical protein